MIFLLSSTGFFVTLALFAAGAIGALIAAGNDRTANMVGNGFAALGSLCGLAFSAEALLSHTAPAFTLPSTFPLLSFTFFIDPLSAFFMGVISLIALVCSLYAIGYVEHFYGTYNIGVLGFFYNLFIAGMLMVVTAHNALLFLIAWELMSLASYFLVSYEHHEKENVRAGFLYFIMTHTGTAFITLSFILLYHATGSFDFSVIQANAGLISPALANIIFFSSLIGFGIKSGIIPLHIWLPSAHPAAPSHVSALMSGVMIKSGIYMLARTYFDFLPQAPLWWGIVILLCGVVSSVVGVLYALTEHDIKRLLAYHSIENIGIIYLGLGSALIFTSLHMPALALLGFIAALFHTLNHAIFKALLFLAGGATASRMHTRNIERYGGIIKYMPVTALCFLVGSMAISGLPPFNGFFSEWLTFQALFAGAGMMLGIKILFVFAIAGLALTSGLAAACFVKAFGVVYLARPRSEQVLHVIEVSTLMKFAMGTLAALTLVVGFCAGSIASMLATIGGSMQTLAGAPAAGVFALRAVQVRGGAATLSMPAVLGVLIVALMAAWMLTAYAARKQKSTTGTTWDCGTALTPRMEITATGFSHSIIVVMRGILQPSRKSETIYREPHLRHFPISSKMHITIPDLYMNAYRSFADEVTRLSHAARRIQHGNINAYILYILLAFLVLIFVLAL